MILLQGKGVSKGIAEGPLYFLQKPDTTIVKETGKDIEAEKARIAEAKEKSAAQLLALAEKCREEAGDDAAFVFETHAMFLDDDDYVEGINDCLESEQCNAEYAVRTAGDTFAAMFAAMDDAYMSARAADIKDITQRLLNNLMGIVHPLRRRPRAVRDPSARQVSHPGLRAPGRFGHVPHRHPRPYHGHPRHLRPGRCTDGRVQWP